MAGSIRSMAAMFLSDEPAASFDLPIRPEDLSSVDGGWFTFFFECAPTSGAADEVFAAPLTGRAKSLDKEDGEE